MANPDPTTFQPPPALIKGDDFTDPLQEGSTWHFRFKAFPDFTQQEPLDAKINEYMEKYISPSEEGKFPATLPPLGDGENRREVVLTERIVTAIALLEVMQFPEDETDRWNFNTWAYFYLIAPSAFEAAGNFASDMIQEARTGGKNLQRPDTASASGPSSTTGSSIPPSTIINSLTGEIVSPFYVPSDGALELNP